VTIEGPDVIVPTLHLMAVSDAGEATSRHATADLIECTVPARRAALHDEGALFTGVALLPRAVALHHPGRLSQPGSP
jgi:hypothetical protein